MQLKHPGPFAPGYESIVGLEGSNADMLMEFGILTLSEGETWSSEPGLERAFLLMRGEVEFCWTEAESRPSGAGMLQAVASRSDIFDAESTVLHLSRASSASIRALAGGAELALCATENTKDFPARLWLPAECRSEERGKGTMRETSTRIVRTVFDDSNAPESRLVLGEVIGAPGKWSSYPPHHHPQPEVYHYRFLPVQGFGLTPIGDRAYILHEGDTILIRDGEDHPQVTAPGYAMWYLWVIRHLDGQRYITPTFTEEHRWVTSPDADIWLPPSERQPGR